MKGESAFVIDTPRFAIGVVDRLRSIPLFYGSDGERFILADQTQSLRIALRSHVDDGGAAEYLVAGYVTGDRTLYAGIFQISPGECLVYDKQTRVVERRRYFRFAHRCTPGQQALPDLMKGLDDALVNAYRRLRDTAESSKQHLAVPLSGGLDWRIVVAMLHRVGCRDVTCFAYGQPGFREIDISRRIAAELGYSWFPVVYTPELSARHLRSSTFLEAMEYVSNDISIMSNQEYPAMAEIHEKNLIPEGSTIVPGHTDLVSGGHIPDAFAGIPTCSRDHFLRECIKTHYANWTWDEASPLAELFAENIMRSVGGIVFSDAESCADAMELFDYNERQAKFIINSVRLCEFFGYRWRTPLCDAEYLQFFMTVPIEYRIHKTLYTTYCRRMLLTGEYAPLALIECTTPFTTGPEDLLIRAPRILREQVSPIKGKKTRGII